MKNAIDTSKKSQTQKMNVCGKCNGTGWFSYIGEDGLFYAKECDCGMLETERENNKLKFANIPEMYKNVSFKDVSSRYFKNPDDKNSIKAASDGVKFWINNMDAMVEQGRGLYFWSQTKGSGKTMMMSALANELMNEHGKKVKFATSSDILDEIRSSYNKDSDTHESKLLSDLVTVEFLAIDDMGCEKVTDWVSEKFYQIVNKRYLNKKVTFFTSNYEIKNLPYDDRIGNRIRERCFSIHFPETSVREFIAWEHEKELKG